MSFALFVRRAVARRGVLTKSWTASRTNAAAVSTICSGPPSAATFDCSNSSMTRSVSTISRRQYSSSPSLYSDNADYPAHTLFPMPALSPTMDTGSISAWHVQEGDSFTAGTSLCSIDTDKASVDFEAQDDGVLAKILVQSGGEDVAVGTPICVVVDEMEDVAAFANYTAAATTSEASRSKSADVETKAETTPSAPAKATNTTRTGAASLLLPSARHLAESSGLDATVLAGSGKGGRVTKGDVMEAIANGTLPALASKPMVNTAAPVAAASAPPPTPTPVAAAAPAAATPSSYTLQDLVAETIHSNGTYEDVSNNKMRKIIASRLTDSKRNVPHFYTAMPVNLDQIMELRKQLANDHGVKISVNDFVIKCSAMALRDVPQVNATISKDGTIHVADTVDISVAVATPTALITPIVFNTDQMGLADITNKVKDLAGRAREGKLSPEEYQGGTFSISNLGMFGIDEFSAVINPPQAAILAVGGGSKRVVPTPYVDGGAFVEQTKPSIQTIMTARLSADRRVVDEPTAALFLSAFRQYINEPQLLML